MPYLQKHVPTELFEYPNWIAYRLSPKANGKIDKIPINPHTGGKANTTDPATWGTIDQALACAEQNLLSGVGFVFTNSPFSGTDLDECINGTKTIEPWASEYIILLDSYTEASQSGKGVHIITRGDLPKGGRKKGTVEMYDTDRFFAFTGDHVKGTPETINERTEALAKLHRQVFGEPQQLPSVSIVKPSLSDEAIIRQLISPVYGCPELWRGEFIGYESQSEADMALCSHIAFWTRSNAEQIDRVFRRSGLYRDKWDERHYSDGRTYGEVTIQKVLEQPQVESIVTLHWARQALEPQPPIDWIVEDLFSAGSIALLVGEPGSKKTYAMLDAAISVATGKFWLGHLTQQSTVLLVDEESGPRRLARRIGMVLRGHDAGPETPFAYATLAGFDLRSIESVNALQTTITAIDARFVILDALVDFMLGGDENAVQDVQPVFHNLRTVVETTQSAAVVIHHTNKAGGYRGSSAMKGACDLMLIAESKQDSDIITFKTEKARDVEPTTFAARANFGIDTFNLSPDEPEAARKHFSRSERYVLKYLSTNGESLIDDIKTHADICSPESARRAVYALADKGEIERKDDGGRGTKAVYALTQRGVVSCEGL